MNEPYANDSADSVLSAFRAGLPRAGVMQIGAARMALLREIEEGQPGSTDPEHLDGPIPRLTFAVLIGAAIAGIVLVLLMLGIVPRPH